MNLKNHWGARFFIFAFFGFVLVNLMFLNFMVLTNKQNAGQMQIIGAVQDQKKDSICDTDVCVPALYDAIYQATASQRLQVTPRQQQGVSSQAQEYYIQLGTGTNATNTWANVGGAAAYIDSSNYGNIQTVTFEASVYIPTGNQTAYVQLYNATDQHPVWFSQVSIQGGAPQLLISQPITLDPGEKLYQVQMMTQLHTPPF